MLNVFPFVRSWRRKRLAARPFPEHWAVILREKMSFYDRLDESELEPFHTRLKVFLWEKKWAGVGGLEVTEKMQVLVSASAARIARRLPLDVYDRLTEVVIYPSHYLHPDKEEAIILGQAHHFGTVVLSWDAVREGIATSNDARDTAIHEFAHVLDVADGAFDGTPILERGADYKAWVQVMGHHFARLQDNPARGFLRAYGAENEAEFFAVATEAFFENPRHLKHRAPDLYEVLSHYFNIDPV
ncbi:MAG: zinc-dependent peptidase [Bradymonadaceae bacterium]